MSEESFGNRLRRERERRHIALSSISANSKINVAFLQGLERDDLSKWPSGIFRRAFIRAYAEGVGLDPDLVVREFLEHYPDQDADQPAPAQAWSPKNRATPRRPSAVPGASTTSPFEGPAATDIRLRLGDPDAPVGGGRVGEGASRRLAAVACDAAVVTAAAGAAFMATGWFWLPMSVAMFGYILGGILLLGNTPGACLLARRAGRPHRPSTIDVAATSLTRLTGVFGARDAASAIRDTRPAVQSTVRS